jgi:hypothetical protein
MQERIITIEKIFTSIGNKPRCIQTPSGSQWYLPQILPVEVEMLFYVNNSVNIETGHDNCIYKVNGIIVDWPAKSL